MVFPGSSWIGIAHQNCHRRHNGIVANSRAEGVELLNQVLGTLAGKIGILGIEADAICAVTAETGTGPLLASFRDQPLIKSGKSKRVHRIIRPVLEMLMTTF